MNAIYIYGVGVDFGVYFVVLARQMIVVCVCDYFSLMIYVPCPYGLVFVLMYVWRPSRIALFSLLCYYCIILSPCWFSIYSVFMLVFVCFLSDGKYRTLIQ